MDDGETNGQVGVKAPALEGQAGTPMMTRRMVVDQEVRHGLTSGVVQGVIGRRLLKERLPLIPLGHQKMSESGGLGSVLTPPLTTRR